MILGSCLVDVTHQNWGPTYLIEEEEEPHRVASAGQEPRINYEQQSKLRNSDVSSTKEAGTSNICTEADVVPERTRQGSLQSNRTQRQSAAHNQNQDAAVHKQHPQLHPHA
jgi:hypothetical protein